MFNIKKIGRPVCKIEGGKLDKKVMFLSGEDDSESDDDGNTRVKLPKDSKFIHTPNTKQERDILYITGASGSGKSYYASQYIKNYKKAHPDNLVVLLSPITDDEKLNELCKRIKIDESLIKEPLMPSDVKDSLVIFDDIDVIQQKPLREALYKFLNQILELGRHTKTSCIITNHLPTNGTETRRMLNECHSITYFPASGSKRQLNNLLENYVGMDTKDIRKAKKLGSRWVTIFKNYPQFIMTERDLYKLADED
jgi:predicted AAA+ superfamily ATPase